jgi:hypothetical protein
MVAERIETMSHRFDGGTWSEMTACPEDRIRRPGGSCTLLVPPTFLRPALGGIDERLRYHARRARRSCQAETPYPVLELIDPLQRWLTEMCLMFSSASLMDSALPDCALRCRDATRRARPGLVPLDLLCGGLPVHGIVLWMDAVIVRNSSMRSA